MSWTVSPEPSQPEERAALLEAVERALADDGVSAWWRSGLDALGDGPVSEQPWGGSGVVEP